MTTVSTHLNDLADFISSSPTSWHAAETVASRLEAQGFQRVDTAAHTGAGKYVLVREGAVAAWITPENTAGENTENTDDDLPRFRILGAHTDSPSFRLKPRPNSRFESWNQIGVEVYGGPLANSWLDRDLAVAGRLVTEDGEAHLVHSGPIARIPQLAIHLDRKINAEGLKLDRQRHLVPIVGSGHDDFDLVAYLARQAGIDPEAVAGTDLMLIDTQAPGRIGVDEEFFAAGRLDNLASVHSAVVALERLAENPEALQPNVIPLLIAFDHEEVGSETRTGAGGPMLQELLGLISVAAGAGPYDTSEILQRSWQLSADCGHLVHPNYPERHDPHHHPQPNQGPILKVNATKRYTTEAIGQAAFVRWSKAANVPAQYVVSHNEMPSGSTIGPISETRLGIPTLDVGIGLLSMHSVREMCGAQDPGYLTDLIAAFFTDPQA